MTGKVVVVRPEPGLSQTLDAGRAIGLNIAGYPLFRIRPVDWNAPDSASFDGLLIGSANAFRHGGGELDKLKTLPVYAVGETTAKVARDYGFTVKHAGKGGLSNVVGELDGKQLKLLRLSGRKRVDLQLPAGVTVSEQIAYEALDLPFSKRLVSVLNKSATVLLHSAAAAEHFARECDVHAIARSSLSLAVLAPRIAKAAGENWQEVRCADQPNDAALLEIARKMCQQR